MRIYDYIIIGSGLFGSVLAERLHTSGKSVFVIEKRMHTGGNCFSYADEATGINIHKYGTHVFHTSYRDVWEYINRFTQFLPYQHKVYTTYHNKVFNLPINLQTLNSFYAINLKPAEVDAFLKTKQTKFTAPANFEEQVINLIGSDLYHAFIKGYTEKQWGCRATELPAGLLDRIPIRRSFNDAYFDDIYQGLPVNGYAALFERLLDGISIELGTDFFDDRTYWLQHCHRLIYTGPLDRYFNHTHGRLNWRSVRFEEQLLELEDYQGTSVMNYADAEIPFTRIHEPRHLDRGKSYTPGKTIIQKEYPCFSEEKYYPVHLAADEERLIKYQSLVSREYKTVFGGRLAEYKYYDMDDVIKAALDEFTRLSCT